MNREEYEAARAALLGNPPRHPKIGTEQVTSIEELNALAARLRLASSGESQAVSEPPASPHAPDQLFVAPPATSSEDLRLLGDRIIAHIDQRFEGLRTLLATTANVAPAVVQDQSSATETVPPSAIVPPAKTDTGSGVMPEMPEIPEIPEIPENLGTLSFNQLKALAKDRGVDPIPRTQAALIEAIEATRKGAG